MRGMICKAVSYPVLALGCALLWGVVEFVALQRSRRRVARCRKRSGLPRAQRMN